MKTKIFLMVIFAALLASVANAQINTNPKLNYTVPRWSGKILVVDWEDHIQISDKTLDDFNKMQASIATHDTQIAKQQETIGKQQELIKNQQEEIGDLKAENKEMKSDISQLERTMNDMKKKLEEMERKVGN